MSPDHPRWEEFRRRLGDPVEGLYFPPARGVHAPRERKIVSDDQIEQAIHDIEARPHWESGEAFNCTHTDDRSLATTILKAMGLSAPEINA